MRLLPGGFAILLAAGAACGAPSASIPDAGERIYRQRCYACHALDPARNTAAGPTLHRIVGRSIAAEPGFNYSPALRRLGRARPRWTPDLLDRFLADPEGMVPGTEMGLDGLRDQAERQALIDWLEHRPASAPSSGE